jgi:hypothetical protein
VGARDDMACGCGRGGELRDREPRGDRDEPRGEAIWPCEAAASSPSLHDEFFLPKKYLGGAGAEVWRTPHPAILAAPPLLASDLYDV